MRRISIFAVATFSLVASMASASQDSVDTCIRAWGKSPFKAGHAPDKTIATGVKVFGIGGNSLGDLEATKAPSLVLVKPTVSVLGKSSMRLENPNGWYCFDSNVSVLGKIEITAHCKAHLASAKDGANVMGASDTNQGVTVLGSLRVKRVGCEEGKPAAIEN